MDFSVGGLVVVVTGAAQGIGEAIARACAADGASVAVCDRNAGELERVTTDLRDAGATVHHAVLDVRDDEAVSGWIDAVASELGRIDVLVNNAGGGFGADFEAVSAKGEDALIRENFTSVTSCIRCAVPHMPPPEAPRGGGGSIINITSIEAHRAGPGFAVYSAMKAAIENLTKSLALELGPRHIRVNCVAPDVIPTPGILGLAPGDVGGDVGGDAVLPVHTPLPYAGHVDDVAAATLYLASRASSFVTGTTVHVDGGNHAAGGWRRNPRGGYTTH